MALCSSAQEVESETQGSSLPRMIPILEIGQRRSRGPSTIAVLLLPFTKTWTSAISDLGVLEIREGNGRRAVPEVADATKTVHITRPTRTRDGSCLKADKPR